MSSRPMAHLPARIVAVNAAALCLLLLSSCSTENAGEDDVASDPAPTASASSASPTAASSAPETAGSCEYPSDGAPPAKEVVEPPSEPIATGAAPVQLSTSVGVITAELDGAETPCTVNSFLSLASQSYFDGTTCHRLTTDGIFVLQCGDPTATGTGGPGYSFADELAGFETYPAGTLAMANGGLPDTNGSQFFVVYQDTQLPPSYAVFGQLDEASVQVVQDIAAQGTVDGAPEGAPKTPVTIESVVRG